MIIVFTLPLALAALLVLTFAAPPARAADSSFDCLTAKTLWRICPRIGEFGEPFFHTSLRAEDARRLKPDE
jgi:hypothetical protein